MQSGAKTSDLLWFKQYFILENISIIQKRYTEIQQAELIMVFLLFYFRNVFLFVVSFVFELRREEERTTAKCVTLKKVVSGINR